MAGIGFLAHYMLNSSKDNKVRLEKHHSAIISVLRDWRQLKVNLVDFIEGYPKTSFPLYIELIDRLEKYDRIQQIKSHFHDKKYKKINSLFQNMKSMQTTHNDIVKMNLPKFEDVIINIISENGGEICEGSEEQALLKLFQYYQRVSDGMDIHLENNVTGVIQSGVSNVVYTDIYASDDRQLIFNCIRLTENEKLIDIKNSLNRNEEIQTKLKELETNVKSFNELFQDFCVELTQVITTGEDLGINGNCVIDDKLKWTRRVKCLFND